MILRNERSLDETDIDMGCCRYGDIQRAVNMVRGKPFRQTSFLHDFVAKRNTKFIFSGVICKYLDFATKVCQCQFGFAKIGQMKPIFVQNAR